MNAPRQNNGKVMRADTEPLFTATLDQDGQLAWCSGKRGTLLGYGLVDR